MRATRTAAVVAVLAAALAGCAAGDGAAGTAPTTAAPTSGAGPPRVPAGVVATGVVRAGVEQGCLLLAAEGGRTYLLVGGDRSSLRPGARVRVTGSVRSDLMTTCQQGTPLRVASATPVDR